MVLEGACTGEGLVVEVGGVVRGSRACKCGRGGHVGVNQEVL